VSDVIDHVGIRVGDLRASCQMYEAALAELGISVLGEGEFEGDAYVLFGRGQSDDFSLHTVGSETGSRSSDHRGARRIQRVDQRRSGALA
jgi:catechol 2,3-dioxygenase-like lactoylglutathione lyase family enzyme